MRDTARTAADNALEAAVEAALGRLDLATKVRLLSGADTWSLPAVPEIGLAAVIMSDGPVGVRGTRWSADDPSLALPSPTALAATWDPALAGAAGRVLGQEARRKGVHVLLAPTVNMQRSPLGGRHFEAYSEDPVLTAAIGIGYVAGVQEQGVAATVKHFVANDSETERFTVSVRVGERALREVYLAPFEAIVREAGAWAVMSAYNAVNEVPMTTNGQLQCGVLKDEWAFDGVVISDWMAAHDTVGTATGGLDIVMPAMGSPWGDKLVAAVRDGSVPEPVIDDHVRRVLRLAARVGALAGASTATGPDRPDDRPAPIDGAALASEIAARSFVLASNKGGVLPLDASNLSAIAVIGALARDASVLGGGSATVFPARVVSPLDGLAAALPPQVQLTYAVGASPREHLSPAAAPAWTGLRVTFSDAAGTVMRESALAAGAGRWMNLPEGVDGVALARVEISGRLTAGAGGVHQVGVRGLGRFTLTAGGRVLFDGEIPANSDDFSRLFLAPPERRLAVPLAAGETVDVRLVQHVEPGRDTAMVSMALGYGPPASTDEELLAEAERVAAASDVAVVVVGTTEEVESEGFDRADLALPGRQDELVRRVAAVGQRTVVVVNSGSPVGLPWAGEVDAVLLAWFGGQEVGRALADVLLGASEPGGRLPTTWPAAAADAPVLSTTPADGELRYDEGIFIGYRAWERSAVAPRYPFGHGDGYTTWEYEQIAVDGRRVSVTIRNTGTRPGREVVQIYVGPDWADPDRPTRWLAGFSAVTAAPGAAVTAEVELPVRAFQVWHSGDSQGVRSREQEDGWRTIAGRYRVEAAHSIADRRLTGKISIP